MKIRIILLLLFYLAITDISSAQVTYSSSGDTVYITGGTMTRGENTGLLESTINGDTSKNGARKNPNRVYALNEGQVYYQLAPINVYNPTGTITIIGIPSKYGATKPVILLKPTVGVDVGINVVYGSLKFVNVHYQVMQMDGNINNELFYCGTANKLPQSLTIDNCLFEFCNIDIFDCTNEWGAIGGWPYGAKFHLTNSYFRNLFNPHEWWGSRVFQCTHPIDTLWIENCTVTTGGLTFLQRNALTEFAYINHNTIVNNMKYWLQDPYYINLIVTNNIFINQSWSGEDSNLIRSGQDPDNEFMGAISIDTVDAYHSVVVQPQYYNGDSSHYSSAVNLINTKVYISNNINFYDTLLINGYYKNSAYINPSIGTIPTYTGWWPDGPYPLENIPGIWMNLRTKDLFKIYSPPNGGFVEENTITANPQTITPGIADASVVTAMAQWNQNQWGDPLYTTPTPVLTSTKYIYGDYDPTTLPGIVNGSKSDKVTGEGTGIQVGITKFTDLTENFSQSAHLSKIDNLPIGALIWDDAQLAAFNSANDLNAVNRAYIAAGGKSIVTGVKEVDNLPHAYSLSQNYPNPFNPTTTINFSIEKPSNVTLTVYNILGQKVAMLVNRYMREGSYTYQFNASKLSSGVYIYRLEAGEFNSARKMIVLK